MTTPVLSDDSWAIVEPLLPAKPPKPRGDRPPVPNRVALTGIVFVRRSGIPWEMSPQEPGSGSGRTRWRWPRDWQSEWVRDRLHRTLLNLLGEAGWIDLGDALICFNTLPRRF